jgi:hypothetical protein
MSVRVDLQGISARSFIDRRGALGVMTGQYALLEYQTAGFSPQVRRVLLEQCLWIAESGIFCGFRTKGHLFPRVRLKAVPGYVQGKNKMQMQRKSSQYKHRIQKFLFIADDQESLIQSSRKACSVQIGDE